MNVARAGHGDAEAWRALAREVESLFGPMVGEAPFERALVRNIDRGTAWCIRDPESAGSLLGAMFFRERDDHAEVGWLAVASRARRRGAGTALLRAALGASDPSLPVTVVTFGEDHPGGPSARAFYESLGFTPGDPAPHGPEGGSRQTFILTPRA